MQNFIDVYILTDTRLYSTIIIIMALAYIFLFGGKEKLLSIYNSLNAWFTKIVPEVKEWWNNDKQETLRHDIAVVRTTCKMALGGIFMTISSVFYFFFELVYLRIKHKVDVPLKSFYNKFSEQIWWFVTAILFILWGLTILLGIIVVTDFLFYFWVIIAFAMKNLLLLGFSAMKKFLGIIFGDVLSDYPQFINWQKGFRNETHDEFIKFTTDKHKYVKVIYMPIQLWFLGVFYILGL